MGKTILFVSHDLGSIGKYCDRVVLLNKGVKLAEGKPKDMIDLYKRVMAESKMEDSPKKEDGHAKNRRSCMERIHDFKSG